jgi:hypothetical protein
MLFKHQKCYSPTSRKARVLVLQASVAAYLQDLPSRFLFPTICSMQENKESHYDELRMRVTFQVSSTKIFFLFTSSGVHMRSVLCEVLAPASLFYEEAMCKGSTRNRLPYAAKAVPQKDHFMHLTLTIVRKGRWVIGPNYCASHPWRFCTVGDVVAQRYDVLCDWLWDACHMAGVCWESHCEGFVARKARTIALSEAWGSCHKTSNNQPIHKFGSPLGIPYPSCTA